MNAQIIKLSRARALPAAIVIALVALAIVLADRSTLVIAIALAMGAGLTALSIPPEKLLSLYFVYLVFEGAAKIWTRYNPVVHVGSDLLLTTVLLRLMYRYYRHPELFPPDPARDRKFAVVVKFLALFWVWVVVQFTNPWGLGLLPSVAGLKIYVVPVFVFFCVGYLLRDGEWERLPYLVLAIGVFEAVVAVLDWLAGPFGLVALNPMYAETLVNYLKGSPYRPFGTTHLPGNPAVWMYHAIVGATIALYMLRDGVREHPAFWRWLALLASPLVALTIIVCQIRLVMIRTVVIVISGSMIAGRKYALGALLAFAVIFTIYAAAPPRPMAEDTVQHRTLKDRFLQALSRARTLEHGGTWFGARGTWGFQEIARRARFSMTGVGLSRVGASSRPWQSLINRDRYFGPNWTFADNVALAVFTELGVGGLVTFFILYLAVAVQLAGCHNRVATLCMINCMTMLLSGYASEGILFQPDAAFFWLYAAIGLRYRGKEAGKSC